MTVKEKKPSSSRYIFTRLFYCGGFDYQSRRFPFLRLVCNNSLSM